jgi:hypothetical protein
MTTTRLETATETINLDNYLRDVYLSRYFTEHVLRHGFPILQLNRQSYLHVDVFLSELGINKASRHCCLGIAAMHLKATAAIRKPLMEIDIARHGHDTVVELNKAIKKDATSVEVLQTVLLIIFFQCLVDRPNDCFLQLAWHHHFQVVTCLAPQTQLCSRWTVALTSWIDILGATMLGRRPAFADQYRRKRAAGTSSGLADLMGCNDQVMYLIAEIADLEAAIAEAPNEVDLSARINTIELEFNKAEAASQKSASANVPAEVMRLSQLRSDLTALFRLAAQIYLHSLVPSFDSTHEVAIVLVEAFSNKLDDIPGGLEGLDRSLVWPLLLAGSFALPGSLFRTIFDARVDRLGETAEFGSFGKVQVILRAIWLADDAAYYNGQPQRTHWRSVVQGMDWDFLAL